MFKNLLFISLFIINLSALTYEDAEDLNSKRWIVVSPNFQGKVSNIFDEVKQSRVMKFEGDGTKSIYKLAIPDNLENIQMDNSFFTWEMNYSEDFVILIVLDTLKGKRHLIYTPDAKNSYLQYGLNSTATGEWEKHSRNLEKDLQLYEKENKIISIKDFIIKGSGAIDNIKLKKLKTEIALPVIKKTVETKPKVPVEDYSNDIVPVLKLKGNNPLILKVGEEYVEAGASAKNRDGSEIDIKITSNIDILTEGKYTVIYFATNKLGNSSIDKRQVIIGKVRNKKEEESSSVKSSEQFARCEELPDILRDKVEEIEALQEEEVSTKEEVLQKEEEKEEKPVDLERPSRPGL